MQKAVNEKHFGTCPKCHKYKGLWGETGVCDDCDEETSDRLVQENLDQWDKEESEELENLDRDTPGIFQIWEDDVAELIVKPEELGNLGACEPEQLEVMNVASMAALANIILGLYHQWLAGSTDLVLSEDKEVAGEEGETDFATYLTFDLRQWLKQEGGEQQ